MIQIIRLFKMAASDQLKYSTDESEENKYARCSPCSEDGSYTVASQYCVDCEMYFCGRCVKFHNRIPSSKSHHVNDVDSSNSSNADDESKERETLYIEPLRCTIHHDTRIDIYCKNHDEVCCGKCAVVKHRLCATESIAEVAKAFKSNPEVHKCREALTKVLTQLKQEKEKRTESIDCIGKQKLELIETVDKYEEKIINKVKELANISRTEIRSNYGEHRSALDIDVQALDSAMTTTTTYVDKLEQTSNEQLLFATVNTGKIVTRDGEMLLQAMVKEWKDRNITFYFDKTLENAVDGMKALGRLENDCTVKEYKATFQKKVNVRQSNESGTYVYDMCLMDSGDLLLTDHNYKKLQRFNSDLQFKDAIMLSGYPVAVCKIDKHAVAVRIWYTKVVHIVSVDQTMQLRSTFTLADNGFGMTYDSGTGEIFACEENKVSVYCETGNKLRTYDRDTNSEPMFSQCRQIALSENKKDIYVTDLSRGVIVLDESGHLKMKVSLSGINDTWPLCILPGSICLTGSQTTGLFVQIDEDGKQTGTLIETNNGRDYTYCAVYDYEHSRLIVGGYQSIIAIYTLSAK